MFPEMRGKPPDVIDDPVAWIIAIEFGHAQNFSNEPGVFVPSDQPGDLSVGGNVPFRDSFCNGEYFIDYQFIV